MKSVFFFFVVVVSPPLGDLVFVDLEVDEERVGSVERGLDLGSVGVGCTHALHEAAQVRTQRRQQRLHGHAGQRVHLLQLGLGQVAQDLAWCFCQLEQSILVLPWGD